MAKILFRRKLKAGCPQYLRAAAAIFKKTDSIFKLKKMWTTVVPKTGVYNFSIDLE